LPHLLFVDDELSVLSALSRVCRDDSIAPIFEDLKITTFQSPYGALEFVRRNRIDVCVADYRMIEMNGATLLTHIRTIEPHAARIMISAHADREGMIQAINDAAIYRFLAKPWSDADLKRTIFEALTVSKRGAENGRLAESVASTSA